MIAVWRPKEGLMDEEYGVPFDSNDTIIAIQKSKPKGIGEQGIMRLKYSPKTHRYYDEQGYSDRSYIDL